MRFWIGKRIPILGLYAGISVRPDDLILASVWPKPRLALLAWRAFLLLWWAGCTWYAFSTLPDNRDAAFVSAILAGFGWLIYAVGSFVITLINSTIDQAVEDAKRKILSRR
jgi:hypothetical protein